MVGNDAIIENIGRVVDIFNDSDMSKNDFFDEIMFYGLKPVGIFWNRGENTSQIVTMCSEVHSRATSICLSILNIACHYATFSDRRKQLSSAMNGVLESHVNCTLPFELGDDAAEFVKELTSRCTQFAGDQVVKNIAELLACLVSLDVLPRFIHDCNSSEFSISDDEEDDSVSQLSKLSGEYNETGSESGNSENDEQCEESEDSNGTYGEEEGDDADSPTQTHDMCREKQPVRKRRAESCGSDSSECDLDEAVRISRSCKRAR